jgi:hypothetical protein
LRPARRAFSSLSANNSQLIRGGAYDEGVAGNGNIITTGTVVHDVRDNRHCGL